MVHVVNDVDNMKYNELRKTLKQYGLSTSGKKIDLQLRLNNYLHESAAAEKEEVTKQVKATTATSDDDGKEVKHHDETKEISVDATTTTTTTPQISAEQRRRMEENRKRALQIRQMKEEQKKRLKSSTAEAVVGSSNNNSVVANPITPAAAAASSAVKRNPYSNPYAKASTTTSTPAVKPSSSSTAAVTVSATKKKIAAPKKIAPTKPPPVISAWGDCRLDLWEAACQCGGAAEHSPDVRMCRCGAALDAGLDCQGCGGGVLLIKSGPRGNFWGCSNYKKRGCKFTKRFGPPHDAEAAAILAQRKQSAARMMEREREELSRIKDQFESQWRSECRCGGAKNLNTFECKMQSEGGCGMLPLCPEGCGGQLFLHPSKYGDGKWWGCSNFRNGLCKFRANYEGHV